MRYLLFHIASWANTHGGDDHSPYQYLFLCLLDPHLNLVPDTWTLNILAVSTPWPPSSVWQVLCTGMLCHSYIGCIRWYNSQSNHYLRWPLYISSDIFVLNLAGFTAASSPEMLVEEFSDYVAVSIWVTLYQSPFTVT